MGGVSSTAVVSFDSCILTLRFAQVLLQCECEILGIQN